MYDKNDEKGNPIILAIGVDVYDSDQHAFLLDLRECYGNDRVKGFPSLALAKESLGETIPGHAIFFYDDEKDEQIREQIMDAGLFYDGVTKILALNAAATPMPREDTNLGQDHLIHFSGKMGFEESQPLIRSIIGFPEEIRVNSSLLDGSGGFPGCAYPPSANH